METTLTTVCHLYFEEISINFCLFYEIFLIGICLLSNLKFPIQNLYKIEINNFESNFDELLTLEFLNSLNLLNLKSMSIEIKSIHKFIKFLPYLTNLVHLFLKIRIFDNNSMFRNNNCCVNLMKNINKYCKFLIILG